LDEVQSRYSFYTGKKALFKLCQNLVEEGLATTRSWEKSKADPLAFIDESLRRWCFLHGLSRVEAEFSEFSFAIRDADDHQLRISVQHWHLGHFVCRAPLTALEEHVSGLGAAFYQLLAYAAQRASAGRATDGAGDRGCKLACRLQREWRQLGTIATDVHGDCDSYGIGHGAESGGDYRNRDRSVRCALNEQLCPRRLLRTKGGQASRRRADA
jgi:hypothetical protein